MFIIRELQRLHYPLKIGNISFLSKAKKPGVGEEEDDIPQGICGQPQSWKLGMVLAFGISGAIVTGSDRAFAQIQAAPTVGTLMRNKQQAIAVVS